MGYAIHYPDEWARSLEILEGLWKYGLKSWTRELIFELLLVGTQKLSQSDEVIASELEGKTNLVNPMLEEELEKAEIIRRAKANYYWKENKDQEPVHMKPMINMWPANDDEAIELFPFRSPADAPFRRARLLDVKGYVPLEWLNDFRNLDYITVTNLCLARLVHGEEIYDYWRQMEMLQSLNNFIIGANSLNLVMKKYKVSMPIRLMLAEGANLTGFRQMPMPGFDIVKETKALAEGGEPHGINDLDWLRQFETAAMEVMAGQEVHKVEWITLEDYIKQDLASTAGASSIGKVHYEFNGKKGKFKARKNLLYDILSPEEIYKIVMENYDHQVASAFVKPEMGKLRIAVTGDIESYYVCSWLNYLAGHCYTTWRGNTLEEGRLEQMRRMEQTLEELIDSFSIPFDYKGFDHQPTLDEVAIELRLYLSNALHNTPAEFVEFVKHVIDVVIESFYNSVTIVRDESGKKWTFKVTGGVQSGVRLTSLLGNFWNQTMTQLVTKILGTPKQVIAKYIRGDDSSIITKTYEMALLFRLGYAAFNAQGADAKYGIHFEQTEFLRIWYANDRCYGYPNRAIPALVQRKPWTSDPWDPEGVIRAQLKTVRLIERRLDRALPQIESIVIQSWVRKRKLSARWLAVPILMGGLGILPWNGWRPETPMPKLDYSEIKVKFDVATGTSERYITRLADQVVQTKVELTEQDGLQLQQEAMRGKAGSDDLPGLNRIYRNKYKDELTLFHKKKTEWVKIWNHLTLDESMMFGLRALENVQTVSDLRHLVRPSYYGRYRRQQNEWRTLQVLARYQDMDLRTEFIKYAPDFFFDRRQLEKKGMHRTMATDWLFGHYARYSASFVHDQAAESIEQVAAWLIEQKMDKKHSREMWWYHTDFVWEESEKAFARSRLNKKLLMY